MGNCNECTEKICHQQQDQHESSIYIKIPNQQSKNKVFSYVGISSIIQQIIKLKLNENFDKNNPENIQAKKIYYQNSQKQEMEWRGIYYGQMKNDQKHGFGTKLVLKKYKEQININLYVGEYLNDLRSKGYLFQYSNKNNRLCYFFNGQFKKDEFAEGILLNLGSSSYYDGKFLNNKYEGEGKLIQFNQNRIISYKGNFMNGLKHSKSKKAVTIISRTQINECSKIMQQIKKIVDRIPKCQQNDKQIINDSMKYLNELFNFKVPQFNPNSYFKKLTGQWSNGIIQGIVIQQFPEEKYKFVGVYKNNQRNGYGEQIKEGEVIAKGFYVNGEMIQMKNNQFLLKGFKILQGELIRNVE